MTAYQEKLVNFGRKMMDLAAIYPDHQVSNQMSRIGDELTTVGSPFGKKVSDIPSEDWNVIKLAMQQIYL